MNDSRLEDLWQPVAPQVLGAVVRRYGHFADAEDAVQEALVAAAEKWPVEGVPDDPRAWLVRVAGRRMADHFRSEEARRRREDLAASWSMHPAPDVAGAEDTLRLLLLCCHPALTPGACIPLALRAVAGLTTREIATAFLVPEATMAQRISRAKARLADEQQPFAPQGKDELGRRLPLVLHMLYLLFNEGYAASGGNELARAELSDEATRLTRAVVAAVPDDSEAAGLLALMLLTDARRVARTGAHGELVPLDRQDRSRWNGAPIAEGVAMITAAMERGPIGEYQLQAAIAAVHDQSPTYEDTDWAQLVRIYGLLERLAPNPMVTLNRAVAVAMANGPDAGLAIVDRVAPDLNGHHRLHAVRGHLLERTGDAVGAAAELRLAAAKATNAREQQHLFAEAARVGRIGASDRS
jgi:RNA polymerase sigma factor (sigma-70 family)